MLYLFICVPIKVVYLIYEDHTFSIFGNIFILSYINNFL